MRTRRSTPVLTAYSTVLAYGILEKGRLSLAPALEDCLAGITGSFTKAGTGRTCCWLFSPPEAEYAPVENYQF